MVKILFCACPWKFIRNRIEKITKALNLKFFINFQKYGNVCHELGILFLFFKTLLLITLTSFGQEEKFYVIKRVHEEIKLDGKAEESFWSSLPVAGEFQQKFPVDSVQFSQPTEVRLAFDEKNIYLHAKCLERSRKPYVIQSLKRDFEMWNSDCFIVYFDTYNDKTNAFCFVVNPYNAQAEIFIQN